MSATAAVALHTNDRCVCVYVLHEVTQQSYRSFSSSSSLCCCCCSLVTAAARSAGSPDRSCEGWMRYTQIHIHNRRAKQDQQQSNSVQAAMITPTTINTQLKCKMSKRTPRQLQ
jgi:hypothetical protein